MIRGRVRPFADFVRGLPAFLRDTYSLDRARRIVKEGLAQREPNFLTMLERTVFGYARSPYRPLFRHAGCEFGDVAARVRSEGLDAALRELRHAGVYVSFEEFKGRRPIERDGLVVHSHAADFDNPLLRGGYRARTSGSTGAGTPIWVSLQSLADRIPHTMLAFDAHDLLGLPSAMWREALPAPAVGMILEEAPMGQRYEHWFAPPLRRTRGSLMASRFATEAIVQTARLSRVTLPRPEPLPYERADVVAKWCAERGRCVVRTGLSNALRVSLAAADAGLDLSGTAFVGAGEPVTNAKTEAIGRSGGRWISNYTISEAGRIGVACANPLDATDVHYAAHVAAIITHPRAVSDGTVETFHLTSLLPGSPKILLNVETDDYGVIEERACGCRLEEAGITQHLRDIFSVRNLTGEGVTLAGSDMARILEEVLPTRFGGTSVDYQLAEEEDERGFTRLTLIVSPRVSIPDESLLIDAILRELGESGLARDVRSIWGQSGTLRVRRAEPIVTQGGKVRPLAPNRRAGDA